MSATLQPNSALIAAYLDAVIRKDASAVDRFFDPDVEYMVNGIPAPNPAGVLPLENYARTRASTIYPGHGAAGDLRLIAQTRGYLRDFAAAIESGDAKLAEKRMLDKYPDYHVRQFLTAFSIPAYFPAASSS